MTPLATVGILSPGDMGTGVAKLLIACGYRVVTNVEGRSEDTHARVLLASISTVSSDVELVSECDYILSIVPPRDAFATAKRIHTAITSLPKPKGTRLYYLDLNAISPKTARSIASLFETASGITIIDGGIIGSPPSLKAAPPQRKTNSTVTPDDEHAWNRPSIPTSGPVRLADAPISGQHLAETLNVRHIGDEIGAASGLKCCFASTTKGATALCIQAFTTASRMGVLGELEKEMSTRIPAMFKFAQGMVNVPPKAYRWVKEMHEIAETHADDGGWVGEGKGVFDGIAEVFKSVAEDKILGAERTERRKRGLTTDDVAIVMGEGLAKKQKKSA